MAKKGIKRTVAGLGLALVLSISGYLGTQVSTLPTDSTQVVSNISIGVQELSQSYVVDRVVDGDTFEIMYEGVKTKVRLIGVDTPETVKAGTPVQWYGNDASNFTKKTLENQKVRLEFDKNPRDIYGRLLAYVYLPNGDMLNVVLLHRGYAKTSFYYPNTRHKKMFLDIEQQAQKDMVGMWDTDSQAVWESVYSKK
jgi:micrococcal nuclease